MREVMLAVGLVSLPAVPALLLGFGGPDTIAPAPQSGPPELSHAAEAGRAAFRASCADCHGTLAQGTGTGPSLLHPAYGPDTLSDAAFRRAVREGQPPRLWSFGAMPAHPGIAETDIDRILAYVRGLQRAAGI